MSVLVLIDHEGGLIKQPSRSAVAAASKLGDVHALVVGQGVGPAADAASKLHGVSKVLKADAAGYEHALAEPIAALLVALAPGYTHLLSASTATGKNVMPRVAALLDVQPISDVAGVEDADTFIRPNLRRQRAGHRALVRQDKGDHRAGRKLRSGAGRRRLRQHRGRRRRRQHWHFALRLGRAVQERAAGTDGGARGGLRRRGMQNAKTSTCSTRSPTSSAPPWAPRAPRWTRATCRTTIR